MYKTNQIQPDSDALTIFGLYLTLQFRKTNPDVMYVGLTEEGEHEMTELRETKSTIETWEALLEDLSCNGKCELITPFNIGALVSDSCPIIGFDAEWNDFGDLSKIGDVYYYERYQVDDEFEEMLKNDWIVFQKADTSA